MTYAGDVTPAEAWQALIDDPRAVLVDVRTRPEWIYVGLPDLRAADKEVVQLEWQTFPTGAVNPDFIAELEAAGIERDQTVYFLVRTSPAPDGGSASSATTSTRRRWRASPPPPAADSSRCAAPETSTRCTRRSRSRARP